MVSLYERDEQSLLPPGVSFADVTQFLERSPPLESEALKRRRAIMEILLDSVCPLLNQPKGAFAKLWEGEATFRSVNILQLLLYNYSASKLYGLDPDNAGQHKKATQLARDFVALRRKSDYQSVFCAGILMNIISAIFKVFFHAQHPVQLRMSIKDVRLSAYKLHALVLICTEFACGALRLGFRHQSSGQFRIMLDCVENRNIRVVIELEMLNADQAVSASSYYLISRLASVLSAEIVNRITKSGASKFEILFPVGT